MKKKLYFITAFFLLFTFYFCDNRIDAPPIIEDIVCPS